MELMDNIFSTLYRENQTPPAILSSSVSQTGRTQKKTRLPKTQEFTR